MNARVFLNSCTCSHFSLQFPITGHYWGFFYFTYFIFPLTRPFNTSFSLRLKVIEFPWVHSSKFLFSLVWNLFYQDGAELGIDLFSEFHWFWLREPSKIQNFGRTTSTLLDIVRNPEKMRIPKFQNHRSPATFARVNL